MNWGSWDNFWAMGGHAFFVWGSYGLALALMLAEPILIAARMKKARTEVRQHHEERDA